MSRNKNFNNYSKLLYFYLFRENKNFDKLQEKSKKWQTSYAIKI